MPAGGGRFPAEKVTRIGVDADGVVRLGALAEALGRHDKADGLPLVAIHAANNETGVVQPLEKIAEAVKAASGVLVLDAVQAAGRIPLDISAGYADYLILSSHKIGGPQGAGAIVAAADLMMPAPLVLGGGQERAIAAAPRTWRPSPASAPRRKRRSPALPRSGKCATGATGSRRRSWNSFPTPDLRPARRAPGQYELFRHSGHEGRDGADRLRPGRRSTFGGFGLLLGQGRSEPCAGGDGP